MLPSATQTLRKSPRRFVERCFIAGAAADAYRLWNLDFNVTVEKVARNVELRRSHFEERTIKAAGRNLGDALRIRHMALILCDL